jgi:hypothetical protein
LPALGLLPQLVVLQLSNNKLSGTGKWHAWAAGVLPNSMQESIHMHLCVCLFCVCLCVGGSTILHVD